MLTSVFVGSIDVGIMFAFMPVCTKILLRIPLVFALI